MTRSIRTSLVLILLLLSILVLVIAPGCKDDDNPAAAGGSTPVLSAAWAGIWEIVNTELECDGSTIVDQTTEIDTLCTGDDANPGDDEEWSGCQGTITDTRIDMTCSGTETFPGGDLTFNVHMTVTRSGDTMTGTATITLTMGDESDCAINEIVGTRIAPAPDPCVSSSMPLKRRMRAAALDAFQHR